MIMGKTYFWRGVVMVVAASVAVILRHILKISLSIISLLRLFNEMFMSDVPLIASFLLFLKFLFKIRLLQGWNQLYRQEFQL